MTPFLFAVLLSAAAVDEAPCPTTPEVIQALGEIDSSLDSVKPAKVAKRKRLEALKNLLAKYPRDVVAHRAYQDAVGNDAVLAEYELLDRENPSDPIFTYLHWRFAPDTQTEAAMAALRQSLTDHPRSPWAHLALAERLVGNPKTNRDAKAQLTAFLSACPEFFPAYGFVRRTADDAFEIAMARQLRGKLDKRTDALAIAAYPTLWRLELKPKTAKAQRQARITTDLKRLQSLPQTRAVIAARVSGFEALGDAEGQQKATRELEERFGKSEDVIHNEMMKAQMTRPRLRDGATPQEATVFWRAEVERAEAWIQQWLDSPLGLRARLSAQAHLPEFTDAQVLATADALLAFDDDEENPVATAYLLRGVRLEKVPALVDASVAKSEKAEAGFATYLSQMPPEEADDLKSGLGQSWFGGSAQIIEALARGGKLPQAHEHLEALRARVRAEAPEASSKPPYQAAHRARQGNVALGGGLVAQAEGRAADAAALFAAAIALNPKAAEIATVPLHAMWKKAGGTAEGLDALTQKARSVASSS